MLPVSETPQDRWQRFRRATAQEPMPFAIVDLEALEHNVATLTAPLSGSGKTLRIATKSIRSPDLVARIQAAAGPVARGLMTYTATETAYWAERGERDLLLAYPTATRDDAQQLAAANANGATARVAIDSVEHLEALAAAARARSTRVPVVLDIDVSYRPMGGRVHIGVRRSPLRDVRDIVALAARAAQTEGITWAGVMAYEAQIAGLGDTSTAVRWMKRASMADVVRTRADVRRALETAGLPPPIFNGGGTGSLGASVHDASLTEVTAGSGFLDSHLFDHYAGLRLQPAVYFALQVVRRPADDLVTCHGGGYVASGAAGRDRLPVPALPDGLSLLDLEGAGEVQTPLRERGSGGRGGRSRGSLDAGSARLALGDPVFFRHAKAGELAEHVAEYILVHGSRAVARAPTYRGLGKCFLG
jgi:D-serine deaminase-like pyridoxal phosphate-dependent protein